MVKLMKTLLKTTVKCNYHFSDHLLCSIFQSSIHTYYTLQILSSIAAYTVTCEQPMPAFCAFMTSRLRCFVRGLSRKKADSNYCSAMDPLDCPTPTQFSISFGRQAALVFSFSISNFCIQLFNPKISVLALG